MAGIPFSSLILLSSPTDGESSTMELPSSCRPDDLVWSSSLSSPMLRSISTGRVPRGAQVCVKDLCLAGHHRQDKPRGYCSGKARCHLCTIDCFSRIGGDQRGEGTPDRSGRVRGLPRDSGAGHLCGRRLFEAARLPLPTGKNIVMLCSGGDRPFFEAGLANLALWGLKGGHG